MGPAFDALPDGSTLELVTAASGTESMGSLRLAGTCHGGTWSIEHAWPPVDADTLRAALDLARTSPLKIHGLAIGHDEGGRFTFQVASAVFAARFGETWPCPEPEDPLEGIDLPEGEELFEAMAERGFSLTDPLLEAESARRS